jgi:phosphomannomutase
MSTLMKSVSGIRGIVGDTLTPELILSVGAAFAKFANRGLVVIGRDSRPTGEAVSLGMQSVLSLAGCDVVDLGVVPTPTVQIMVEELCAAGGIVISASHNPIDWNAFKLIDKTGSFLNAVQIPKFFKLMEGPFRYPGFGGVGNIIKNTSASDIHIDKVFSVIDTKKISSKKFKVSLDSVNGAGSVITPDMLGRLKCSVDPVFCEINGIFPRIAEPLPENLSALSKAVIKNKSDIGFAQDPDADRLAVVDEKGRPIGEEYTVALVTEHLLAKKKGTVVVNLSTTRAVQDIAIKYGCRFVRSKVGEINVVDEMRKLGARIGGEGNGGVISPEIHLGRDSLAGIGYILEMMAEKGKPISEIVAGLPRYVMKKGKVNYDPGRFSPDQVKKIKDSFKKEKVSSIDGLRIDFEKHHDFQGGWVHLRPSNTEPVFRIITEGKDAAQADAIYNYFSKLFSR